MALPLYNPEVTGLTPGKFADPFLTYSDLTIPRDFYTAIELALFLSLKTPSYLQACKRTVSHFLTNIEFVGKKGDRDEREDLRSYLVDSLKVLDTFLICGMEQLIFGNSFLRIHYPFDRYLVDNRDGLRLYAVGSFGDNITYNYSTMTYRVPDPRYADRPVQQRPKIDLEFFDRKSLDMSKIQLRHLNPTRVLINMNFVSGSCDYIWRFEEFFVQDIKVGQNMKQINETPMDMLKAIKNDQDFQFNEGNIYHFREPFLTGVSNNGWGIPGILTNIHSIHQVQVYKCINEAIGKDYMLPLRILSPSQGASAGADLSSYSMHLGQWSAAMRDLVAKSRKNRTDYHTVPFPMTYQELGANGKTLAPVDLLKYSEDSLMNGAGFPINLWNLDLQMQQIPTALRLFENVFIYLYRAMNNCLQWITKEVLDYCEREQIGVKLQKPSVADDLEKRHVYLQLAAGGEISRAKAYSAFNIDDPIEEAQRRTMEDLEIRKTQEEEQQKYEREMTLGSGTQVVDAMMQGQGPPPGGGGGMAPGAPSGGNVTPLDIEDQGAELAKQLLSIKDDGQRRKQMMQISATNPTLYAVVQRMMKEIKAEGASQGRQAIQAELQAGGGQ